MRTVRTSFQVGFLALIAFGLYQGVNCEAWCPFGGVELLTRWIPEGTLICSLASSNLFVIAALLGLTLIARRAFCGWICPLGALGEWSGRLGERWFGPRRDVSPRVDAVLSLGKYGVLAVILGMTYATGELFFRAFDPCYALISLHGHEITAAAYVVLGGLVVGSLFVHVPFCRWLCPLAAVLNPLSRFGLLRIAKNPDSCSGCALCDKACPMRIPVSKVDQVTHARCIACLECSTGCPRKGGRAVDLRLPRFGPKVPRGVVPVLVVVAVAAAFGLSETFSFAAYTRERGDPDGVALRQERFEVEGLRCRGTSEEFCKLLFDRMDSHALEGYLRVECFPSPGVGWARVTFDGQRVDREKVVRAFSEPELRLESLDLGALLASPTGGGEAAKPTKFRLHRTEP